MTRLACLLALVFAAASIPGAQTQTPAANPDAFYQLGPDSLAREGVPKGEMRGPFVLPSEAYPGTQHTYWIYVPAQYDAATPASLMIFNDGQAFMNMEGDLRVPNVLDNLIWRREIPVMIAVFINPGRRPDQPEPNPKDWGDRTTNRPTEYNTLDDKYARVIVDELMPALHKDYNISRDPEQHGIGGASSGAIAAFTVAWERPSYFRKVLSLIGSFVNLRGGDAYADIVRKSEKKPIRIYLQDGRNDNRERQDGTYDERRDWFLQNVRLTQALTERGYDVAYSWGIGRHSQKHGGAILPDMMRWLWRDHAVSTNVKDTVERSFNRPPGQKSSSGDTTCDTIAALVLASGAVARPQLVAAGAFKPPGAIDAGAAFRDLPQFCRVETTLRPSSDSEITIEVWMPSAGWNGKYLAVGNGGFNGTINHGAMRAALARGYATSSTDTGHTGNGAAWALGHPEKVIDFGWRAVHEMTVAAKEIISSHYGRPATLSYWNGCSAGGRQAMKAAQRFPADFNGIIAGAPGLDWTSRAAQAVRLAQVLEANPQGRLLQPHRERLHQAVIGKCDAVDGVKDGLIENPERCSFDPSVLACKGPSGEGCLSKAQIDTVRMMYSSPPNPKTGRAIAGLAPGSELGWTDLGWTDSARATGLDQFRFIVFGNPAWTTQQFSFDADIVRAEQADRDTINALDPDLRPFFDRGGKLIHYHGWSDPQISPGNSTQYYSRVRQALGGRSNVHDAYRLFMAPGMGHCGGGSGPNTFDMVSALETWVEKGQAPDRIIASRTASGRVERTRPLCPYPEVAVYTGSGSIDEAANFDCRMPPAAAAQSKERP